MTSPYPEPAAAKKNAHPLQRITLTLLKIAIAVVGIWYVVHNVTWNDTATINAMPAATGTAPATNETPDSLMGVRITEKVEVTVLAVEHQAGGKPDRVTVQFADKPIHAEVEGKPVFDTAEHLGIRNPIVIPDTYLERIAKEGAPDKDAQTKAEYNREGLKTILVNASSKWYLIAFAAALLGIPFFVSAIRWRNLMIPQGINMPLGKSLQLTFVGQFYSIMLPGITGGDLVKIVYAARLTGSKTKSFITIILDRVIGLVALMVIAGASAGIQLIVNAREGAPPDNTLLNVFLMIVGLLAFLAVMSIVYFSNRLRRMVGIEWFVEHFGARDPEETRREKMEHLFRIINMLLIIGGMAILAILASLKFGFHLRWAEQNPVLLLIAMIACGIAVLAGVVGLVMHATLVSHSRRILEKGVGALVRVDDTLRVYRGHFGLLVWAFGISLISQMTLPLAAWLCGIAFGMTAPVAHYLAYVPVAVLAASLPISPPQGFGVMDYILLHFFALRGAARASQAFALAQAVRFLPMLWNLMGAYWVVTGEYSRQRAAAEASALSPKESAAGA